MLSANSLEVHAFGRHVGTLALTDACAAFAYDAEWLASGFSISPFSLPLDNRVFLPRYQPFEGLFGVFSDSLPDGWGRLLLDRLLRKTGEDPSSLSPLDRLALVGNTGMGALEYKPHFEIASREALSDFDEMARECRKLFNDEYSDDLDRLFRLGGSSGGARPKVLVDIDGEAWIVKFHTASDGPRAGIAEYEYALCARECGINVPEVRLLPSDECPGYFAVRRFDRADGQGGAQPGKVHMASAGALLETSHRVPSLDYRHLFKLTRALTNDYAQLQELYRRMCFNVFAHNRDDHAKNFSYLHDSEGSWRLSPAYDMTYSNSMGGEHATTVAGEGRAPGDGHLLQVAREADLDCAWAQETAEAIRGTVGRRLGKLMPQ